MPRRTIYAEGYFKVSRRALESSLWLQDGETIKVFITLLAMSQDPAGPRNGMVFIAKRQLAARCFLSEVELDRHIAILEADDTESRTQAAGHGGRRIETLPNGFRVLNYGIYHDEAKDRLLSRLRSEAGVVGGTRSGQVRLDKAQKAKQSGSKAEASRKQNEATETETETETETKQRQRIAPAVADAEPQTLNPSDVPAATDHGRTDGNGHDAHAAVAVVLAKFPSKLAADLYLRHYPKGTVPGAMFKAIRPLCEKHGWEAVAPQLEAYLLETDTQYLSWSKFASAFGSWGKAGKSKSVGDRNIEYLKGKLSQENR